VVSLASLPDAMSQAYHELSASWYHRPGAAIFNRGVVPAI